MTDRVREDLFDVQASEVEALRAIYTADFDELSRASGSANWRFLVRVDHEARNENELDVHADLIVSLPGLYPMEETPKLSVVNARRSRTLSPAMIEDIEAQLNARAKAMLGGEMLFELIQLLADLVRDKYCIKSNLHQQMLAAQAKAKHDADQLRLQAEAALRERERNEARLLRETEKRIERLMADEMRERHALNARASAVAVNRRRPVGSIRL
jgi:hypothetical protein